MFSLLIPTIFALRDVMLFVGFMYGVYLAASLLALVLA